MLCTTARRVPRRLSVPERDGADEPYALGGGRADRGGPPALFRAQLATRSLLSGGTLGGGDGWVYESTMFSKNSVIPGDVPAEMIQGSE